MIFFYVFKYRIEIRKVKIPTKYRLNKRFLFLQYFKQGMSSICRPCINYRPQYKNCKHGFSQWNKKGICYHYKDLNIISRISRILSKEEKWQKK